MAKTHGWAAYCDHSLDFQWPGFRTLQTIWEQARCGEVLPRRPVLTARLLKDYLTCITLYERFFDSDGARHYRVRLMGTRFAQVYGDLTGKVVDQIVTGQKLARFHVALDETLSSPAPLRFIAAADIPDKSFLSAEYFMGPLADRDGKPAMILACAHFSGEKPWAEYFAEARLRVGEPA